MTKLAVFVWTWRRAAPHSLGMSGTRNTVLALCAAVTVVLLSAVGLMAYHWATEAGAATFSLIELPAAPISIKPNPRPCIVVPDEDMSNICLRVEPLNNAMSISLYLHALRVFGLDWKYSRGKLATTGETLRLFADEKFSKQVLGRALMIRTPYGIRCTSEGSEGVKESHRDYCLAVLSEQELPACFSMVVDGKTFTFKDFLADSIANFHLGQEEIEWTALSYAVWIPPARKWANKYGETFTFDDLAIELMRRPLSEAACAGTHVVHAMTVLTRVDREVCSVMSPEVRSALVDRLRELVQVAGANQAPDGSWGPDWYEEVLAGRGREPIRKGWSIDSGSLGKRVLATSHVSEWLLLLPEELRISDDRLQRAGRWLHAQLKTVDSEFVRDQFCACTHGTIVLQLIRYTGPPPLLEA